MAAKLPKPAALNPVSPLPQTQMAAKLPKPPESALNPIALCRQTP